MKLLSSTVRIFSFCILVVLPIAVRLRAQSSSPDALYRDAMAADQQGNVQRAISLYEELIKLQPGSVEARTNLGVALAHVGRYGDAVAQYREALKRDPENAIVRLDLALAWYKQAEFEQAAHGLEELRRDHTDSQQTLYLLADCYLRLGRYREAVGLLRPAYEVNPDDRAVDYALGTALIRDGQIQAGEVIIDRILKSGEGADVTLLMGAAQLAGGEYKNAAATIHKALDLDASLPGAWSLYGRALLPAGKNEDAKTAFRRAIEADPNDFDANLHLGSMLRHDSSLEEAAPLLERALRLRPASMQARFQIGALNLVRGKLDTARKDLEQVEREVPDFQEVHVQLASLYARLNLKADSRREREIIVKLNEKAREKGPQPDP